MGFRSRVKSALHNLLHRSQIESELDAEIRSYVDAITEERIANGMSPNEARRLVLAECGGMEQVKQSVREVRAGTGIELLWQDLRYTLRQLGRNPAFTWTAVLTLGLGIGATTSIFSAVYALLLRPLPYLQPNQLVYIASAFPTGTTDLVSPDFVAGQHGLKSFSQIAGYRWRNSNLTGAGDAVRVDWVGITANFLPMLGVSPGLGRGFRSDEEHPSGPAVVMLSDRFWRSYFHADPEIVGKSVAIDGKEQTIIGVLPPRFNFPDFALEPQVYGLADLDPDTSLSVDKGVYGMRTIGRLRVGVSASQAQTEVQSFFLARGHSYPPVFAAWWTKRRMVVESLQTHLAGDDRQPLLILLACVMAVLLIACANVANLQMARSVSRRHEMAVRGALGASRYRLMRQSLLESLMLSALSAALGLGIAYLMTTLIRHAGSAADSSGRAARILQLPLGKIGAVIHVDGWVLVFTIGLALITALLFGIAPSLSGTRVDLRNALQSGARRITAGRQQRRLRHGLLVLEIGLAVVLLSCAGLLMRSFVNVLRYETGFDARDTVTGTTILSGRRYQSISSQRSFEERLLSQLKMIPGVRAAALSSALPLGEADGDAFSVNNPDPPVGMREEATSISITPDYFNAVGTPLLQGRPFTSDDTASSARVVIVNRAFARRYFGGNAIGRRLYIGDAVPTGAGLGFGFVPSIVVGVVADVRHNGIEQEVKPEFYVPIPQIPAYNVDLILHSSVDAVVLANAMRRAVSAVDREQPLYDVQTMEERVSSTVSQRRLIMLLIACFALLAVLLSAVGIYGVFMYSVSQRTQEMGIRLALGCSRWRLLQLIVLQAAALIFMGGALGLTAALVSAQLLTSMLSGVSPHDPLSFSLAWILMTFMALLASTFPARNAARTDIISVLHSE